MAKRYEKQQQSDRCYIPDCEVRPVTESDKWCKRKMPNGQIPAGDAPWGYVVTIPYCPNRNTFLDDIHGYIIRTKKRGGKFLLQVIPIFGAPSYGVKASKSYCTDGIEMSIKNLNKSDYKWGKEIGW